MSERIRLSADGGELATLAGSLPTGRYLLGITGPPGVGKSTLAAAVAALRPHSVVVPMDGFHLADVELDRRRLRDRKGAPETFDGWGYAALLEQLRARPYHVIMAPMFERDLEQPIAGAIPIPPTVELVVTEGNYLLLDEAAWRAARGRLDVVWHLVGDRDRRRDRLVARHVRFGKTPAQATAWVQTVDDPNATRIEAAAGRADLVIDVTEWVPQARAG